MHLTFLCPNHRVWLNQYPRQASHCYSNACDTGWLLYQEEQWEQALNFLGTAYETAEILLSSHEIDTDVALEYFLFSLAGLTQTLIKLDRLHDCKEVYVNAIERLKKEEGNNLELQPHVRNEVNRLSHELGNLYCGQDMFSYAVYANAYIPNQWNTTLH